MFNKSFKSFFKVIEKFKLDIDVNKLRLNQNDTFLFYKHVAELTKIGESTNFSYTNSKMFWQSYLSCLNELLATCANLFQQLEKISALNSRNKDILYKITCEISTCNKKLSIN